MLTLTKLKVRGFRGFRGNEEFDFDKPATLLFGENHCGKSSTLNALEWALFGDECTGARTGIRERIGWQIANQHMEAPDVLAEVEIEAPGGPWTVRRTLKKSGRKLPADRLELTSLGGETLTGAEADQRLAQLLGASFRDFMATVYQHQEAIRAVLTQEPRERNDAMDRLLGLSDYRNLLDGINAANVRRWHKGLSADFTAFEGKVQTALTTREKDLEDRRQEANQAGVPSNRLNEKAALQFSGEVRQALAAFAAESSIAASVLELPGKWQQLERFEKASGAEINHLRGALPDLQEQETLFRRRGEVAGLKSDIEAAKGLAEGIGQSIRNLDIKHGGQEAVDRQIAERREKLVDKRRRLREANSRAALVREAIAYLEKAAVDEPAGVCPLCEGPAPHLLQSLRRQWEQVLQAQVARIEEEIRALEADLRALDAVAQKYKEWDGQLAGHADQLMEYRRRAGELLDQTLTDRDDPLVALKGELIRIQGREEQLVRAIEARQARLDEIAGQLEKVRLIREILQQEEKKRIIERIQESPEYQELEALRDRAAELVADVDSIKEAISAVSHDEARDKLAAAETIIDRYFRRLTRHPAVSRFRLALEVDSRTGRNSYSPTDQDGRDLTPVLSQGDLNALALAMFLGLACSAEGVGSFGFVLLDDPSQSLGLDPKEQLVAVLNEVAASKKLIVATMDREFRDCWRDGVGKTKTEYLFDGWTPADGPSIRRR
jgi:DNA repair exonuclease SbcCD ATPase subunit